MRKHRALFTRNHLPKHASFQASRWRSYELAAKTLTPADRCAVSSLMPASERKIAARSSPAAPHAVNEVERVANTGALRANHAPANSALAPAHGRHRPFPERDLDLDPAHRDHDGEGRVSEALATPGQLSVIVRPILGRALVGRRGLSPTRRRFGRGLIPDPIAPTISVKFSFGRGRKGRRKTPEGKRREEDEAMRNREDLQQS